MNSIFIISYNLLFGEKDIVTVIYSIQLFGEKDIITVMIQSLQSIGITNEKDRIMGEAFRESLV